MKIFSYTGSKREESISKNSIEILIKGIQKYYKGTVDSFIRTPLNSNISECDGSMDCFFKGRCTVNDDMHKIKREILESDIIILASPVYFHAVSGSMKTFIDRISYWSHLLKLAGKMGVYISVSSGNGNEFVNEYLDKILYHLGVVVIKEISITTNNIYNFNDLKNYLDQASKEIVTIVEKRDFNITESQEGLFKVFKYRYQSLRQGEEYEFWLNEGIFQFDNFRDFFNSRFNNNL